MAKITWLGLALGACSSGGGDTASLAAAPWLVEVTAESGVDFLHATASERGTSTPEILGAGAALFDADSDGDLDLYLVNACARNAFYEQVAPLSFVDATAGSGTGEAGFGMGAAVGDIDADGDDDLFVANVGPDRLFRNRGDGTFEEVSASAGVRGEGWSSSAAFADLNTDGSLDLFVVRYLDLAHERPCRDAAGRPEYCGPNDLPGVSDLLYENEGGGTFRDTSEERGITGSARRGLGLVCADLALDGRLDVFVANDNDPNQLWILSEDGRFQDQALPRGVAYDAGGREEAGMGVACSDFDGDGDLDLLLSHLTGESDTLYLQQKPGGFRDATAERGFLSSTLAFTGFGLAGVDLDHDARLEVLQVNGRVTRGPLEERGSGSPGSFAPYAQRGFLLQADERGIYRDASELGGTLTDEPLVGRGLCVGDLDGDGDLDLVATAVGDRARIWRNDAPRRGSALRVRAIDRNGAPALGARVTAVVGERRFVGLVPSGTSYLSSPEAVCHLGLGPIEAVDGIEVVWPDGTVESFPGTATDRALDLVRGKGR